MEYRIVWNQLGCQNVDFCLNAIWKEEGGGGNWVQTFWDSVFYGS